MLVAERVGLPLELVVERMWQNATALPSLPVAVGKTLEAAAGWVSPPFFDPLDSAQRIVEYLTTADRDLVVRYLNTDAGNAGEYRPARARDWSLMSPRGIAYIHLVWYLSV